MRIVENCNLNTLKNAILHPNRILENTHDLLYILDGEWEIIQDGVPFVLKKDDVIFLHAGYHHYGENCCAPDTSCMFIHFGKLPGDCLIKSSVENKVTWRDAVLISSLINCKNNPAVKKQFKKIIDTYYTDGLNREIKLSTLMVELFCILADASSSFRSEFIEDSVIRSIVHSIRTNPQDDLNIDELAKKHFFSSTTLRSRFKKATGTTMHSYQLETRMKMAYNLILTDESIKIKDVALLFGFCDEYHFSKLFKKKFGVSPSEIKRTPIKKVKNDFFQATCW